MKKLLTNLTIIFTFIGFLFGAYIYVDDRYVHANEYQQTQKELHDNIKSLEKTIEYDHMTKQRNDMQNHLWSLQDHYINIDKAPQLIKDEVRQLNQDIGDLNDKIKGWAKDKK